MADQPPCLRGPSALPDDCPLDGIDDLARALGGDATSWTGDALRLVAKSDREHRDALRDGILDLVRAWEIWQSMAPTPTAAEFLVELDRAPTPGAGFTCPRCHRTSHHPDDKKFGYCGACHAFTGQPSRDGGELGYVVVVYNQASRRPDLHEECLLDLETARAYLKTAREHTRSVGRGETYAIGVVTLLEDTTGDDR